MAFSDLLFLFYFLPLTLIVYFLLPRKWRSTELFAASLVWFAWSDTLYLPLLLGSLLVYYLAGRLLEKADGRPALRRLTLAGALALVLTSLLIFKFHLFTDLFQNGAINALAIPIGISVYQLQGISYLCDVYQSKVRVQKNFVRLGAAIAFFPSAVCGPICPYADMQSQLSGANPTGAGIAKGYHLFVRGLIKKLLFADSLIGLWQTIQSLPAQEVSVLSAWIGILSFAFGFTYFLSGYADMGRGIAKVLGIELPVNFRQPIVSRSVTEFWRRFNLSLGVWVKRYARLHLGGGKNDRLLYLSACLQMLLIWLCTGLWYGAHLFGLLWGVWMCLFILLENTFLSALLERLPRFFQHLYTALVLLVGFVILSAQDSMQLVRFLAAMFGRSGQLWDDAGLFYLQNGGLLLLLAAVCGLPIWHKLHLKAVGRFPTASRVVVGVLETAGLALCLLYLFSSHTDATQSLMRF